MARGHWLLAAGLLLAAALPARAEEPEVETRFEKARWKVEAVAFPHGTTACVARVKSRADLFMLWTFADGSMRVQVFSPEWEFQDGDLADLQVQIDTLEAWSITDAALNRNSVLFDLPAGEEAEAFLTEVTEGRRLWVLDADGTDLQDFALFGAPASIRALRDCAAELAG